METVIGFTLSPPMLARLETVVRQYLEENLEPMTEERLKQIAKEELKRMIREGLEQLTKEKLEEFIEECVERCLERRLGEAVDARILPLEEAMPLVEAAVKRRLEAESEVYPSDVAQELGLDYKLVLQAFEKLVEEEKLRRG